MKLEWFGAGGALSLDPAAVLFLINITEQVVSPLRSISHHYSWIITLASPFCHE